MRWQGALLGGLLTIGTAHDAYAGSAGLCRKAYDRDDQQSWTRLLEQFPDAECAEVARTRLEQLSNDLRECSEARSRGTLDAWLAYSMAHPTGECGLEAVTEIKMREARGEVRTPEPALTMAITKPLVPPAHAEVEVTRAEGAFEATAVRLLFGPGQLLLLGCYVGSAHEGTELDVPVDLTIGAGAVEASTVGVEDEALGTCIRERLSGLEWPEGEGTTEVVLQVSYSSRP
jgi:hypothetical protein